MPLQASRQGPGIVCAPRMSLSPDISFASARLVYFSLKSSRPISAAIRTLLSCQFLHRRHSASVHRKKDVPGHWYAEPQSESTTVGDRSTSTVKKEKKQPRVLNLVVSPRQNG